VNAIVVIEVQHASAIVSPVYDDGTVSEADVRAIHQARFARLIHRSSKGEPGLARTV
jgi:hypothetical protein